MKKVLITSLGPDAIPSGMKQEEIFDYLHKTYFKFYNVLMVKEIDELNMYGAPLKWGIYYTSNY